MIRRAYFGIFAAFVLLGNAAIALLHVLGVFPYFYTLFYPLFCLMPLLMALVGWREKDELKWPSIAVFVLSLAALLHWLLALFGRLGYL